MDWNCMLGDQLNQIVEAVFPIPQLWRMGKEHRAFIIVVKDRFTINTPHIMVKRVTRNKYNVAYVTIKVIQLPAAQKLE